MAARRASCLPKGLHSYRKAEICLDRCRYVTISSSAASRCRAARSVGLPLNFCTIRISIVSFWADTSSPPQRDAPYHNAMTHRIGLAALTVLELDPPDMVSCAGDAGFDSIGLRLVAPTPEEVQHPMIGDTALVRETARRIQDTGVPVLDIELFRLKPETDVNDYRAAVETGARLGAREVLLAGNDPDEARLTDRFAAFCDLAREFGMGANLEPMPWTDGKNFAQGVRVVAAAGCRHGA